MYLLIRHSVNFALACAMAVSRTAPAGGAGQLPPSSALSCDPVLAALFTPRVPLRGRYEVCTTAQPLHAVLPPGWTVEQLGPLEVFGTAGRYDRSAVARLYGGRRASVARGWLFGDRGYESVTLVSPYPDRSLTRLEPGTLVIRFIIQTP